MRSGPFDFSARPRQKGKIFSFYHRLRGPLSARRSLWQIPRPRPHGRGLGEADMTSMLARLLAVLLAAVWLAAPAIAEVNQVRFARQLGLGYLQFYIMEDRKLVEKHARELGL